MAGNQKQENSRKKLRQADKAKVERPFRDFVDLPAHGDRLHLGCEDDAEARRLKKQEAGILERDAARGSGVFGCGHRALQYPSFLLFQTARFCIVLATEM